MTANILTKLPKQVTGQRNQSPVPTQQRLRRLEVVRLKGLQDVSLDFGHTPLTAIMGGNCSGKTTVLHALACAHKPLSAGIPGHKFAEFFRPNTDALWNTSDFTVYYSQRVGATDFLDLSQRYTKATGRWSPRYEKRPARFTHFVSIGRSVPDIETMYLNSMIHYLKSENTDDISNLVRDKVGQILNRKYETFYKVIYAYSGKHSIGVKTPTITYSGLSMSSGEQRVFRILEAVCRAPDYGLILVDEIDLFLHQNALKRLLADLKVHCLAKHKQLIFTTHFPPIAKMYDQMCIYSLNRVESKSVVWQGYSYEAMLHITGMPDRPIVCYVEDDVAEQIVARVATQIGIRKFVEVVRFGPASNAFNLASGLFVAKKAEHTLAVLDGDVYGSRRDRRERVKKAFTGNQAAHDKQRRQIDRLIRTLMPITDKNGLRLSPEQELHRMLHGLNPTHVPDDNKAIYGIARGVVNVAEGHALVNEIIHHSGEPREIALFQIVELASTSSDWGRYTRVVMYWLKKEKQSLNL